MSLEEKSYHKIGRSDRSCEEEKTRATGHAHPGDEPDGSGGGEAVDSIFSYEDQPRPDEADAGNDLGCDTRGI